MKESGWKVGEWKVKKAKTPNGSRSWILQTQKDTAWGSMWFRTKKAAVAFAESWDKEVTARLSISKES